MIKDYYTINELESKFGLSINDIRYLVEREELDLYIACTGEKLILGVWEDNKFIGTRVAFYKGLLRLLKFSQNKVLQYGKAQVSYIAACEEQKIINSSEEYPLKTALPNVLIDDWKPELYANHSLKVIPAFFFPSESPSFLSALKGFPFKDNYMQKFVSEQPDYTLERTYRDYSLSDIRVTHKDALRFSQVEHHGLARSIADTSSIPLNHQLIKRLVEDNPRLPDTELWVLLKNEWESDEQKYDIDCILVEVGTNEFYWKGHSSKEQKMTFATFRNAVSKLRSKN